MVPRAVESAATEGRGRRDRVVASAPGKLILMGEHAAVYGRAALVAALDRRTTVTVERTSSGVALELPTLGLRESTTWDEVLEYCDAKRAEWRSFSAGSASPSEIEKLVGEDPAHVVRVALGETIGAVKGPPPPIRMKVTSELPVGSGFGSSASVAVAIVGALLELLGQPGDPERISRIALEVERRQHGRPSGVDHTTVLRGGLLRLVPGGGGLESVGLTADPERLERLRVFQTGPAAESTGTVVAAVRQRRRRDPEGFEEVLDRMESETRRFEAGLTGAAGEESLPGAVRSFQRCLEELGVVPDAVAARIRRLEKAGGAAKISGAGTLSQGGAGALLAWAPRPLDADREKRSVDWGRLLEGYAPLGGEGPVIGAPGLRIEEQA